MYRVGPNSTIIRGDRREDLGLFKTNLEMITTTEKKLGHLPKLHKTKKNKLTNAEGRLFFML